MIMNPPSKRGPAELLLILQQRSRCTWRPIRRWRSGITEIVASPHHCCGDGVSRVYHHHLSSSEELLHQPFKMAIGNTNICTRWGSVTRRPCVSQIWNPSLPKASSGEKISRITADVSLTSIRKELRPKVVTEANKLD